MKVFQHGDVVFTVVKLPKDAEEFDTKEHLAGIVQHGEATGHAHRLHGDGFRFYKKNNVRYLRLLKPTPIRHEEHHEIMLPEGDYQIGIVREYDHFSEESREVVD